jgi:enediyne biosynthesis protein E4
MLKKFSFYCFVGFILGSCSPLEPQLFALLSPEETGIHFANTITEDDSLNVLTFEYIYNGGGVAVGDFNQDGLPDLYFTGNQVSSKLYLNRGDLTFEDVTAAAGVGTGVWATGVTVVDLNQDGLSDIYVCAASPVRGASTPNLLFINNGPGPDGIPTFTEAAAQYGLADTGYSTQAAFFDYDRDGDLDLYLLTNALEDFNRNSLRAKRTDGSGPSTDRLYRNNGDGTFTDVSREAGITTEGWGLGVAISDLNGDGWPDIYAANDFLSNDLLYINNQDGTFTNRIAEYLQHQSHNAMGVDVADYNNDGRPDIMTLDMMPEDNRRQKSMFAGINYDRFDLNQQMGYQPQYVRNTLQLNNGNGTFSEIGQLAGVYNTDWSWAPLFADLDNDGLKDLLVTNGYVKDVTDLDYVLYSRDNTMFGTEKANQDKVRQEYEKLLSVIIPNYVFRNNGDLTFENKSAAWGLTQASNSNGAVYADLDGDGDLDLVVNNINRPAFVYRNDADKLLQNNFLRLSLQGDSRNRQGLGARVVLRHHGREQVLEQQPTRGYKSSVEPILHFGLGKDTLVQTVEVYWPDGKYQLLRNVRANQVLAVRHAAAGPAPAQASPAQETLFREVTEESGISFHHHGSDHVDFKIQPLLPHKHSQNGPGLAVGDVNCDGLDDFYVGNSARQAGMLYLQSPDGSFSGRPLGGPSEKADDMGALFFDADGDGDLDLYVVSGGSAFKPGASQYQDRLYRNDGAGNFTHAPTALPAMPSSGSVVTAADFDGDGDLDLFVGGRVQPHHFPAPGRSYILRNDQGRFRDVTAEVAPGLADIGMVTAALWTDFDADGQVDLLVVGEWMPLTFLKNENGAFRNVTDATGLTATHGWWNSIVTGDFNGDGRPNYIVGNLGTNSRYQASAEQPVRIYANDYDKNGTVDPILTYYIQGKEYPTHPRDAMTDQIVSFRRRFPRYADYGARTFHEMFTKEELAGARILKSERFETSYLENLGGGKFALEALPVQAQFAPVYGMLAQDFDGDGHLDVLLAGNSYATEVSVGRYNASIGTYLRGDGQGGFRPVPVQESGFFVPGDAKGMAGLRTADGASLILVACHADQLQAFAWGPAAPATPLAVSGKPTTAPAGLAPRDGQQRQQR